MKYFQIQVDVQAGWSVVMETQHLDVDVDEDEVDVYVLLFERKEIHLVLETDTNLVFNAPFARSIYVLHLNVTVFWSIILLQIFYYKQHFCKTLDFLL